MGTPKNPHFIPLMELLAIPLSCQKTATKWLVMMRCGKNFLLTYKHMLRGEIFSTPCIWAKSEFLEAPIPQSR